MKKYFIVCFLFVSVQLFSQNTCDIKNHSFKDGELCNYKVYYNWGALWLAAGESSFSVELSKVNNRTLYHFIGLGSTYTKYDWFFRVRDKYESFADTTTLKPVRFSRNVFEGGNTTYDDYVFNNVKNKVYTFSTCNQRTTKKDSININACTNDVMTAVFQARCMDFTKYKVNDTIPITFVLDGAVYPSYIRYLGKETIENDVLGKVKCIKFSPKLIAGTIFKGGEGMKVWVTDDDNKMPVYVETPIIVGSVKVYLTKYTGLRNKIDCIVK